MGLTYKLELLADAAKYDTSCASSGAPRLSSEGKDGRIRYLDLTRLRCSMKKIAPFIVTADYSPVSGAASSEVLRRSLAEAPQQLSLWSELRAA
jgi:predicted DNA-binding helix-hairpin-helix protein